jgi:hypothetical protein
LIKALSRIPRLIQEPPNGERSRSTLKGYLLAGRDFDGMSQEPKPAILPVHTFGLGTSQAVRTDEQSENGVYTLLARFCYYGMDKLRVGIIIQYDGEKA